MDGTARQRLERVLSDREVSRFYPPAYARALWDAVLRVRPRVMVEFGVHRGFTSIVAALAMEEVGFGHLRAYDWWEDGHRDGFDEQRIALDNYASYGVKDRITLREADFFDWIREPEPCELVYFDIDNDGDKVRALYRGLEPRIDSGLTVLFEGGSDERDLHPSMKDRTAIASVRALTGYALLVEEFPSLSVIARDPSPLAR